MVQANFLEDLNNGAYGAIEYSDLIPRRSNAQFLRGMIALADLNTWSMGVVGPHNFAAKWFAGRARPEVRLQWYCCNYFARKAFLSHACQSQQMHSL